jgi:hypothetical protein
MTRPEYSHKRDLTMSGWIREKLPDSSFGFLVTDLDFILYNWQTKKIMLLEIKTHNKEIATWQLNIFNNIAKWIEIGIDKDWEFCGFHIIKFENTFFNDGKVYFNNKLSTEEEIKQKLNCL